MGSQAVVTEDNEITDSHILEALHATWDAYAAEELGESDVLRVLDFVEFLVNQQIKSLEEDVEKTGADRFDPARVAILQGFQAHLEGLDLMRRFFAENDEALIEDGLVIIEEATDLLFEGLEIGLESFEQSPPKACPQCSADNDREAGYCRACNAVLPVLPTLAESTISWSEPSFDDPSESETTEEFAAVADALEKWQNSEISSSQFNRLLIPVRTAVESDLMTLLNGENEEPVIEPLQDFLAALDALSDSVAQGDHEEVGHSMSELAQATLSLLELDVD